VALADTVLAFADPPNESPAQSSSASHFNDLHEFINSSSGIAPDPLQ
jgi:hypothetical protein